MFEAAIPQNNNNLRAEKGPACDIRHRFASARSTTFRRLTGGRLAAGR